MKATAKILMAILAMSVIFGCSKDDIKVDDYPSLIVGEWKCTYDEYFLDNEDNGHEYDEYDDFRYIFYKNGECRSSWRCDKEGFIDETSYTYKLNGDELRMIDEAGGWYTLLYTIYFESKNVMYLDDLDLDLSEGRYWHLVFERVK